MTSLCTRCRVEKPLDHFAPDRRRKPHWVQAQCKPCKAIGERERRRRNPEHVRSVERAGYWRNPRAHKATDMKWKYGIGWDEFDSMLVAQAGRCAICGFDFPNDIKTPAIDHDHQTGAIRGLLCQRCNRGLGLFRDSPDILIAAADHVRAYRPIPIGKVA